MYEPIVSFAENAIKAELHELVSQTVQDTLNGLLVEEADGLVGDERSGRMLGGVTAGMFNCVFMYWLKDVKLKCLG